MKVGIPKEIKTAEKRVAATPAMVKVLTDHKHKVFVEKTAGLGSGFSDDAYKSAGAALLNTADDVWAEADMIIKVKEPVGPEFKRMRPGQILFTYLHLAADRTLTENCMKAKIVGIAYETVQLADKSLPLLAPMSEVAGSLAAQMGAFCLEAKNGGIGMLLSGVPGVKPARVTVLGGGVSGLAAARVISGMGAKVTIMDVNHARLTYLRDVIGDKVTTLYSNPMNVEEECIKSQLVVGSVLIPGAAAPKLVTRELLKKMQKGSAIVDIAIDQGGCTETSKPTTHENPIFIEEGVVHYCVANMPGAVPRTSTIALTNATFKYAVALADKGWKKALADDAALKLGLNVVDGQLVCQPVANTFHMTCSPINL